MSMQINEMEPDELDSTFGWQDEVAEYEKMLEDREDGDDA